MRKNVSYTAQVLAAGRALAFQQENSFAKYFVEDEMLKFAKKPDAPIYLNEEFNPGTAIYSNIIRSTSIRK